MAVRPDKFRLKLNNVIINMETTFSQFLIHIVVNAVQTDIRGKTYASLRNATATTPQVDSENVRTVFTLPGVVGL